MTLGSGETEETEEGPPVHKGKKGIDSHCLDEQAVLYSSENLLFSLGRAATRCADYMYPTDPSSPV